MSNGFKKLEAFRLVTFAPPDAAEALAEAISAAIPPLGHYDHVAWWSDPVAESGTEQFRALPGADPQAGPQPDPDLSDNYEPGTLQELVRLPSVRLEFSMPADERLLRDIVTQALIPSHPWEKPVILVFRHDIMNRTDEETG